MKDDWKWARVCDLAETCSGSTPSRGNHECFGGAIPWVKTGELHDGLITATEEHVTDLALKQSSLRLLPAGSLLIAMYGQGQTRGRTGLLGCAATTNQACFAILPNPQFDTNFLQLWFMANYQRLRTQTEGRGGNQPNLNGELLNQELVPLPPLPTQRRIAAELKAQLAEVDRARAALQAQLDAAEALVAATLRESLAHDDTVKVCISDCLQEVTKGIGPKWNEYPVLGATRAGLAPAKESVGKAPERYKPVGVGTIFYNPMRILLGSIAMVDEGDAPGITSPDYVVMTAKEGVLHPRWFYQWFRSAAGAAFVRSLSRGAVRERLLFKRLAPAEIALPPWSAQVRAAEIFSDVAAIRKQTQARLATLDRLPAALLRQVFGEAEGGC